ncbi:MAG: flagellar motor protein MotB [Thermodesulfobacteriota bacterium]
MPSNSPEKSKPPRPKVKYKKGHGGHHGGSWKVAYADFVTAMMAFFLLMWLLAMVSPEKKAALSQYFKEFSLLTIFEKGGAALQEGQQAGILETRAEPADHTSPISSAQDQSDSKAPGPTPDLKASPDKPDVLNPDEQTEGVGPGGERIERPVSPGQRLQSELKKAVEMRLGDLRDQVLVDTFEGGVRIQLLDKEGSLMFALGSANMTESATQALKVIAERITALPNPIAVEGHTDALGFASEKFTNWELSTARASAARQVLSRFGLDANRVIRVAGYASTQPLIKENPNDPRNRRISIMVYDMPKEQKPPAAPKPNTSQGPPLPAGPAVAAPQSKPSAAAGPVKGRYQEAVEEVPVNKTIKNAGKTKP